MVVVNFFKKSQKIICGTSLGHICVRGKSGLSPGDPENRKNEEKMRNPQNPAEFLKNENGLVFFSRFSWGILEEFLENSPRTVFSWKILWNFLGKIVEKIKKNNTLVISVENLEKKARNKEFSRNSWRILEEFLRNVRSGAGTGAKLMVGNSPRAKFFLDPGPRSGPGPRTET